MANPDIRFPEQERRILRTEQQMRDELLATRLLVIGWLLMFADCLVLLFLPADFRGGGHSVLLIVIILGVFSIALIGTALAKRARLEKEVRPKQE